MTDYLKDLGTTAGAVHHPNQGHPFSCVNLERFARILMDDLAERSPELVTTIQQYRQELGV